MLETKKNHKKDAYMMNSSLTIVPINDSSVPNLVIWPENLRKRERNLIKHSCMQKDKSHVLYKPTYKGAYLTFTPNQLSWIRGA